MVLLGRSARRHNDRGACARPAGEPCGQQLTLGNHRVHEVHALADQDVGVLGDRGCQLGVGVGLLRGRLDGLLGDPSLGNLTLQIVDLALGRVVIVHDGDAQLADVDLVTDCQLQLGQSVLAEN